MHARGTYDAGMDAARRALGAIRRGRTAILTMAAVYALSVGAGAVMAHRGDALALSRRDEIVADAARGAVIQARGDGDHLRAAMLDFASNLVLGGGTSTLAGLGVVPPYPLAAYRGWVGGIVSVDRDHASRLTDPREGLYYLLTLVLQLIPYSIAGGMGVHVGVGAWRALRRPTPTWLGLPRDRLGDLLWSYAVIVPLFLAAALFEFLVPR